MSMAESVSNIESGTAVAIGISVLAIIATAALLKLRNDENIKIPPISSCTLKEFVASFVTGQVHRMHVKVTNDVGPIWRLPIRTYYSIFIVQDPAIARIVMEGDPAHGIPESEKSSRYKQISKLFNGVDSMLTKLTHGQDWEATRKAVAPSFSMTNLSKMLPELQVKLEQFEDILDAHIAGEKTLVDLPEWMIRITIDVLAASMFRADYGTLQSHSLTRGITDITDITIPAKESDGQVFVTRVMCMSKEYIMRQALRPWRKHKFWDKEVMREVREADQAALAVRDISKKVLHSYRLKYTKEELAADKSILAHLIRSPYPSDIERIADITTFMMAGHDTTAYQLSWIIIELARHPDVLKKLRVELDSISSAGEKVVYTPQNLSKMTYLNYVIKEGMRLWPVAAVGASRVLAADIPWGDKVLRKGSIVAVSFFAMFRRGIQRAEEFVPERWLESDPDASLLKEISFPFSMGKRACVGQTLALLELKLVLATLFYTYDFECISDISEMYYITLKPQNANFKVTKRVR